MKQAEAIGVINSISVGDPKIREFCVSLWREGHLDVLRSSCLRGNKLRCLISGGISAAQLISLCSGLEAGWISLSDIPPTRDKVQGFLASYL